MNLKSERDRFFSYYKEANFLRFKQFDLERDILGIAYTLFDAEKRIKQGEKIDKLNIYISSDTYERIDNIKLKNLLRELILLILLEDIKIKILPIDDFRGRVKKEIGFPKKEAVILFSAGVDSYAGVKIAEKIYPQLIGLFVAHNDQPRIINIVDNIRHSITTEIRTLYAPGMGSQGYSQLRGFLYVLSAGAYCNLCQADNILVTECGPTMYQPMFSPYDSITYTTHPYVLRAAKEVLDILLPKKVNLIIPFEDLTKAEVITNSGIMDFSRTHSCVSQRFGNHDGSCFGCVIKRIACLVSGVKDVSYKKDIFDDKVYFDNLAHLLAFSCDLLNNFEGMPNFETEKILEFGKEDLFHRFALDNLAGFMIGTNKKHQLFKRYVKDPDELEVRLSHVRTDSKQPDFKKMVD